MSEEAIPTGSPSLGELMDDDEVIQQKAWQFVRQLNSGSDELLDAPALIGGSRTYTYRQMFRLWDRYAEVFSALGMTGKNRARVVLFGSSAAEPIIALYALNMCGASISLITLQDLMDAESLERLVAEEGITDIVVPDFLMPRDFFCFLMAKREQMGIRNIVVLRTNLLGPFTPRFVIPCVRMQREAVRALPGAQLMDDLLVRHAGHPISYGTELDDDAFVSHTSGTTKGIHKPVPLSDAGVNEGVRRILRLEEWSCLHHNVRISLGIELGSTYSLVDMMHLPLAAGGTLVTLFLDWLNPYLLEAIKYYELNVLLSTSFVFDTLDKRQGDFSGVELVFMGGAYVSPTTKQHYDAIMRRYGAKTGISIGYGISEAGGACIVAPANRTDDAMGYPLPGINVKILDEDEGVFYDLDDGPRTGVLFINSPSVSAGRIDNKVFFNIDKIDDKPYLNTFDLVRVNEDGSLTHAGRINKYFVNNDGMRFDAGLVEGAISAQPQIRACAIAPHYDRTIHDTIPVLYVQTESPGEAGASTARNALVKVFVTDGTIKKTNLPSQCVIVDAIPRNTAGKVDVRVAQSSGIGTCFQVSPVREDGRLVDVRLNRANAAKYPQTGTPDGLDNMEATLAQMVLWFIPGAHAWYTTGNSKQKRKVLKEGIAIMTQFAQQINQPGIPQGMPFPMAQPPFAMGFGPAVPAIPQMPGAPAPQGMPFVPFMPLGQPAPFAPMPLGQQPPAPQGMPFLPLPMPAPFAPMPLGQPAPMPFGQQPPAPQGMPLMPFPMPAAQEQQAPQAPLPGFPFPQAPDAQAQQQPPAPQGMPAFPFAMPFPTQATPNASAIPGMPATPGMPTAPGMPATPGAAGVQPPFAPAQQPYELYERALKNSIDVLKKMLAQSEAARAAANPKAASDSTEGEEASNQDQADQANSANANQPAMPTAFMPGFGCQQVPMQQQPMQQQPMQQQASGVGILPTNNFLGSILGSFFGASNTDYFYED